MSEIKIQSISTKHAFAHTLTRTLAWRTTRKEKKGGYLESICITDSHMVV